jgi:hypothetical protein
MKNPLEYQLKMNYQTLKRMNKLKGKYTAYQIAVGRRLVRLLQHKYVK